MTPLEQKQADAKAIMEILAKYEEVEISKYAEDDGGIVELEGVEIRFNGDNQIESTTVPL